MTQASRLPIWELTGLGIAIALLLWHPQAATTLPSLGLMVCVALWSRWSYRPAMRQWRSVIGGAISIGILSLWDSYTLVQHWQETDTLGLSAAVLIQCFCLLWLGQTIIRAVSSDA